MLAWMVDDLTAVQDDAGNIKPSKAKSTEKIDGAVAMIMALDRASKCGTEDGGGVYDTRGFYIF